MDTSQTEVSILDEFDGESLKEFRAQLEDVATQYAERGSVKGWNLLSASFNEDYYYDGPTDVNGAKKDVVRLRMESIGKVRGQKISFSARIDSGVTTVSNISVGEKAY